jgi:uncharacterized SAM-binding protein YcdF (DUF218 family)
MPGRAVSKEVVLISYILFKIADQVAKPSNWLLLAAILLILLALFTYRRWPLWLGTIALGTYTLFSIIPVGEWLLVPLENRFAVRYEYPDRADGIVVLSERLAGEIAAARGALMVPNESLLRLVELGRHYPEARLILTGIGESTSAHSMGMAAIAADYLDRIGFPSSRVELEDKARNDPREMVSAAHALAAPKPGEVWLLVGYAWELPRAVGVARKLGWEVTPFPVGYRTDGKYHFAAPHLRPTYYLWLLDEALAEWLAMAKDYWSGLSDELFPSPSR